MYRYTVVSNEPLSPTTLLLTLKPGDETRYPIGYYPGQYAAISFRHGHLISPARCFSLTSSPHDTSHIQFSIRIGGRFTHKLQTIAPGEEVDVRGPYGGFVIDPDRHKELIFAAGGIGIAPFMSMLRHAAATHDSRPVTLLYGVQTQDDIPFLDKIIELERQLPNLHVTFAVGRGESDKLAGQRVVTGFIDDKLLQTAIDGRPSDKTLFICGPPPFMNALIAASKRQGAPQDQLITEAFKQGNHRQTGKVISWPRNMYALGGLGLSLGALTLLVNDIVKDLPKTPLKMNGSAQFQLRSNTTLRESDLDTLINSYAYKVEAGKTVSPSTATALNDARIPETIAVDSGSVPASQSSNGTYTAPSPTTTATTAPAPKCTTTQSGVTTCI
jgi:ferredoxin-NADP reductase